MADNPIADAFSEGMQQGLAAIRHPLAQLEAASPAGSMVAGLVRAFEDHAGEAGRLVALGMLRGLSLRQAAFRAGISDQLARNWTRQYPEIRRAMLDLESIRSSLVEDELTRRAFAGAEDRGSMRALELVAKATMPEYRDKVQTQLTVIHAAEQASTNVIDGWQSDDTASSASN